MIRSNRNRTGLNQSLTQSFALKLVDAHLDQPHVPARDLPGVVREAIREELGLPRRRPRPLHRMIGRAV